MVIKKLYLFFLLTFSLYSFSQKSSIDSIVIHSPNFSKQVDYAFSYLITSDKSLTYRNILHNKKLTKDYCNCIFDDEKNQLKDLWLIGKIINRTKDTLNLVFYNSNVPVVDAYIVSDTNTIYKKLGFIQKKSERFSIEVPCSFDFLLAPNQEKKIILHQKIFNPTNSISKLNILTKSSFNEMLLNYYKEYHTSRMIFGILLGGILLVLGYNFLLFVKTKSKNYLFYSLYLFCAFLYIFISMDKNQNFFLGQITLFSDLLKECIYTFSFILYGYFIINIVDLNVLVKKTVRFFSALSFIFLVFIIIEFLRNQYNFTLFDEKIISIFKYISFAYLGILLYFLSKKTKTSYTKYIFIGSLILFCSYLLQFILFNLLFLLKTSLLLKIVIRNQFIILLGTILEVSFFGYALYLKSSQLVKEKMHLENLSHIKSKFFANISHEFRTPLTLIKSPVQSLQSEITNENQKSKLNLIEKNSNRMLGLVDQLLELSKLDSGKLQLILKEGNITNFLNSLVDSFAFQAKENKISFTSTIEKNTENHHFDKDIIEKIVTNLLSNAIKYTPENESISFDSKVENNQLQLVISNSGSEIKKEELPKFFERFYQKKENHQGVGIGLALVKELVELYKGNINANVQNGILSFKVLIPLEKANENAIVVDKEIQKITKVEKLNTNAELPILLIVDDNQDVRMVLKDIFKNSYQILEAEDGEQALKIAKKEIPDCIISDVMMPKVDGFKFTKEIKSNELTSFIPIVLLTARSSDEAHLEGLKSTADAYLTKPFNNEILKETVYQLIAERKKLHERYSQELVLKPVDIVINSVDEKFIEKLKVVLDKELSNSEFSSEDFAAAVGMSRMQLHRKLKSLLGVSATEFLRNERLKVAFELLKKGSGNISDIAYAVGFNDVSYFSKCFKETYNCTPTEITDSSSSKEK